MKGPTDAILRPEQATYLEAIEPEREPLLAEIEAYARDHGGQPISDPEVASFLAVTAGAAAPRFIVEVGTNIGYGAIVLARAAGPDARVLTIENDPKTAAVARSFIERAGLASRVEVREADALEALRAVSSEIDLVYIDCVKQDYPAYFDLVVPKLSAGGLIIADNVLWHGLVAASDSGLEIPDRERPKVDALREFNRRMVTDPRLRSVILPLGDGVAYGVRIR